MFFALLVGLVFGFVGSVPVAGPISALIVRRGLAGRTKSGVFIALGGALPEAGYAYLAAWGFSTFLARYTWIEPVSRGCAAVILAVLAYSFIRYESHPERAPDAQASDAARSFWLGFSITALNPTLIATWTAATTTLYSLHAVTLGALEALGFALGAAIGIVLWFLILLGLLERFRGRFRQDTMDRIIRGFGWFLGAVTVWFVWRFVEALRGSA